MIEFKLLHPQMTKDHLGYLPAFLDLNDPRPAKEQLHNNYLHGGGWDPFEGFKLRHDNALVYPGDPPQMPLAQAQFRDELIVFYNSAWVAIIQKDRSFEVCRMD